MANAAGKRLMVALAAVVLLGVVSIAPASAEPDDNTHLDVSVVVDTEYCDSGGVQCGDSGTGHTFAAATSDNHNPVRLGILVTLNGAPVTGIPASGFTFSNPFTPAGGGSAGLCTAGGMGGCASTSLFGSQGGLYVLYVHRMPTGNWTAGRYFATLTVRDSAGNSGTALVTFRIP